ncbi:double-strand break repair protein MRE11 isoform X4 [Macrobrachium rosenbergii]|uniref:double-strand break repair protein MRE11 isoform X4 n=2 Tax=Macrobrachium rosenbergii TaxID=79674 RepID=UPI0034D55912
MEGNKFDCSIFVVAGKILGLKPTFILINCGYQILILFPVFGVEFDKDTKFLHRQLYKFEMGATAEDSFRILIATDNHLGYNERDTERGDDSFETFEEILELAVEKEVDMILLGGDLFHENKPSRQCLVRCMDLLRKYTFGDRPVLFDFVSDPVENFKHAKNPIVNYQDPNLNVSIPVFSIHGNHDDPSGMGQFCALEMLSTAGLVNYFGRTTDLNDISISPILLEKGRTKLALYGLSSVKDERLFRLFGNDKVKMLRPLEAMDDWFNIFVLHQNHTKHGMTNYIPESFLDPFLDLVIWGHEHECLIDPRQSADDSFFVVQPGSSVATSLCAGESVEKHVAILEVTHDKKFKVDKFKLKTVRPFVFEDLSLGDHGLGEKGEIVVKRFVENHVREMLKKAEGLLTGHPRQPKKPLIRLRVEYSHEDQMFNTVRFGHMFEELLANPNDMILFKKEVQQKKKKVESGVDDENMDALFEVTTRVEDLVKKYFDEMEDDNRQLSLLTERGLALSVQSYIEKEDSSALVDIVKHQIKKTRKYLIEADVEPEDEQVLQKIQEYRDERLQRKKAEELEDEAAAVLNDPNRTRSKHRMDSDDDEIVIDEMDDSSSKPTRGRGSQRGRARGGRGSRAASSSGYQAGSSRASSAKGQLEMSSIGSPKKGRGASQRGRGRGQTAVI